MNQAPNTGRLLQEKLTGDRGVKLPLTSTASGCLSRLSLQRMLSAGDERSIAERYRGKEFVSKTKDAIRCVTERDQKIEGSE